MIVTGERDHAAILRSAGRVRVLERIGRAIDAGTLAVPDAEHAIDLSAREHADLLAAPHGGRREVFVEARHEVDVMLLEERFRAPQRVVVHAERRAAIAGDEARGVEPCARSRSRCNIGSRTSACVPERKIRFASSRYLSSSPTSINAMLNPAPPAPAVLDSDLIFVWVQHAPDLPCVHSPLLAEVTAYQKCIFP